MSNDLTPLFTAEEWAQMMHEREEEERKAIYQTHPGFQIICEQCGSDRVFVENNRGYSGISGAWGGVDLVCKSCGKQTQIAGNFEDDL
jgi:hypothetical protein